MKWLTLEACKNQCRIDNDSEDTLLELYGESAEEVVLNIINRDYTELVEQFGTEERPVPFPIVLASLALVELSYSQRSPVTTQTVSVVPCNNLDFWLKPYMRLTSRTRKEENCR